MTSGLTRREGARDNLAGSDDVQPVQLRGTGVANPRGFRTPDTSAQQRVAEQLGQWSSGKLQQAVGKQQHKDILDGQMAYQQGQSFEQVEMGGNKFALEGYRIMDAQTLASSLLAAQQQEIAQGGYELDPEAYRKRYVSRLDAMLEGQDPRTADLVREQMAQQMPTLVGMHTTAHMDHLETQNYESLTRSIETVSRDPTATEQLILFAEGGEDSPSSGLSDDRRRSATVDGVVSAFENDNPLAYATLSKAGLLGDNLTPAQQNSIKAAQQRFESRRRSEYNEELFNGEQELLSRVEQGALDPSTAVEQLSVLYAEHGIKMNAADAGAIYNDAEQGVRIADQTRAVQVEEARLRGDFATVARITESIIFDVESSGNVNAVGPVVTGGANAGDRALGGMQVMPKTMRDPGFGVTPVQAETPEEYMRVGREYWAAMVKRHNGDIEAAAVAYNAGPVNADKWLAGGRDYSVLPDQKQTQGYTRKVLSRLENWQAPTPQDKLALARQRLQEVRQRTALEVYEQTAPALADIDDQYKRGEIGKGAWQERRAHVYERYEVARTKADVDHEVGVIRQVDASVAAQAKAAGDEAYRLNLAAAEAAITPARLAWEEVVTDPSSTPDLIRAANAAYTEARGSVFDEYAIMPIDRGDGENTTKMIEATKGAIDANAVYQREQVEIDHAMSNGYLGELPGPLRDRAFEQNSARIIKAAETAAAEGDMTPEQAQDWVGHQLNVSFADAGMVDPAVARRMSAAMRGPLIDKDGNPNPNIVDVVQQYADIKAMNPSAAKTFFTGEGERIRAEAILSRADDPSLAAEATRTLGLETKENPLREDTQTFLARPEVQAAQERVVREFFETQDIGRLHAMWQNDATQDQVWDRTGSNSDRVWSEANQTAITNAVETEIARLQSIAPHIKAEDIVQMAADNVGARAAIIGGDHVILKQGQDIQRNFFGDRAGEFSHDGDINSAVMEWLRSDEALAQYPELDDINGAEMLPEIVQRGLDAAVSAIPFSDFRFDPAMSTEDAVGAMKSGVRPFRSFPAPNGKDVVVQYLRPNGSYSEMIVVPARRAGALYIQRRRRELTQ